VFGPIGGPAEGEEREAVMKPRPPRWYPRRSLWATPASRPRRTNRSSPNPPELHPTPIAQIGPDTVSLAQDSGLS